MDCEPAYGDLVNGLITFEEITNEPEPVNQPVVNNVPEQNYNMINWDLLTQEFDAEDLYRTQTPQEHSINNISTYNDPHITYSDFFQQTQPALNVEPASFTIPSPNLKTIENLDYEGKFSNEIINVIPSREPPKKRKRKQSINSILEFLTNKAKRELRKVKVVPSDFHQAGINYLDYSLEKVNENNNRILQNIEKLNKSLDYAKKQELQDIMGLKSEGAFCCSVCGKRFVYESGLFRHSVCHIVEPLKWQVLWTCVECYQVWPMADLASEHAQKCCFANEENRIREIKTSSLLQCEFCERVFTSIPRLLKHTKSHTSSPNYECSPCNERFSTYKIAIYHWQNCSWIEKNYKFSISRMLLCNVCDRKFKTYEQLYSHRYKSCHFLSKRHGLTFNTTGMMVFQCELCSYCASSIPQLQNHKSCNHAHEEHTQN